MGGIAQPSEKNARNRQSYEARILVSIGIIMLAPGECFPSQSEDTSTRNCGNGRVTEGAGSYRRAKSEDPLVHLILQLPRLALRLILEKS